MKGQRQWLYNCWSSGPCSPQPCAALGALHYSHPLASGQSPCRRRLLLLLLCTTLHGRVSRAGERIHSIKTGSGDPMVQNLYHHRPAHHLKSVRAPWLWLLLWLEWALWFSPPVTLSPSPNYLISPTLGGEQSISPLGTPKRWKRNSWEIFLLTVWKTWDSFTFGICFRFSLLAVLLECNNRYFLRSMMFFLSRINTALVGD